MAHSGYIVTHSECFRAAEMPVWQELNQEYEHLRLPQVTIYADGACFGNGQYDAKAGWGLYFPYPFQHMSTGGRVSGNQTNQRAELTAVYEAIRRAPSGYHVLIYTDSQYAIDCFTKWITRWESNNYTAENRREVTNRGIIESIMRVRRQRPTQVHFKYVAAHSGDPGNTRADENAKKGAQGYYD